MAGQVGQLADCNAAAFERRLNHLVVVGEKQHTGRLDAAKILAVEPNVPIRPRPTERRPLKIEQHVMREIGGRPERPGRIVREPWRANRKGLVVDQPLAAGKPFADLASLEAWARPILIRSVWIDFCYPASTQQLVSAVARLHSSYPGAIPLRTLSPGEEGCAPAIGHPSSSQAHETIVHADAEYLATDEWGRSTLP